MSSSPTTTEAAGSQSVFSKWSRFPERIFSMDWISWADTRYAIHTNFRPNGMRRPIFGLVVHITDGHNDFGGLRHHFSHPNLPVSAHFAIKRGGELAQFVKLTDSAFHVGGDSHRNNNQYWYGVENVGLPREGLSDQQIATCARLLKDLSSRFAFPIALTENRQTMGLGYHSMFHRGHPVAQDTPPPLSGKSIVSQALRV